MSLPQTLHTLGLLTRDEALRLQRENCPDSMNFLPCSGYCWSCTYDLVQHYGLEAIASGRNVTGCPICHKSYCD
jgi:hypothetical protein